MSRDTSRKTAKEKEEELEKLPADVRARKETYDWIQSLMVALIICVLLFIFCIRIIDVSGTSMNPTLYNGDKMLVSDILYRPKAGDVVVFKTDTYDPNKALVKRIIATEGQEINIDFENGIVYVDGEPIQEDYINELTTTKLDFIGPQTVPEGCVFVMGDNRNASTDSRKKEIGMVDERMILGRVYCVIFPLTELGWVS
ncbi:MAG: signal peptidase I [Oscillospiraceae bacterium]|nr:signal peptidase I [Oscillospiraceae bacterium]